MGSIRFTATIEPRGPAAAVLLDDAQVAQVGEGKKVFPVQVTVNGHTWPGRLARMRGENMIGMKRAVREAAGVEIGESYAVEVALDETPREVDVPPALAAALDGDAEAKAIYDGLAFTHRKEYARWIAEAKKEETRERRVAKALEMLRAGETRS